MRTANGAKPKSLSTTARDNDAARAAFDAHSRVHLWGSFALSIAITIVDKLFENDANIEVMEDGSRRY